MDESWKSDLERWLAPFIGALGHKTRARMCPVYVAGLIGAGDRKSMQPMAARGGGVGYDQLHHFIASSVWDAAPLEKALLHEADRMVGGSFLAHHRRHALPKKGAHSVGVAPQYASSLGKTANCQSLVSLTLASRGSSDGRAAALPARELDKRSPAHDASARSGGQAGYPEQAGNCE